MLGIKMHVLELRNSLVILSKNFMRLFTQFHAISRNFHAIWANSAILGQFLHVGYQNACTRAEKFIGNTFKKFHARVHAISGNFHAILAISAIFGPISTCWVSKCMYSSWEIHWWYFHTLSHTPSHNYTQFYHNFGYFSHFWANFKKLGIKMHVLKLRNSLVIHSHTLLHSLTQNHKFSRNFFIQFWLFQPFLGWH